MRRAHPRRQLSPQLLALSISVAYAMIVIVGGAALATPPRQVGSSHSDTGGGSPFTEYPPQVTTTTDSWQSPWGSTSTSRPPTTTTTTTALDFVTISGGNGLVTEVPAGWERRSRSATLDEAIDPDNELRLLRYGGAPATDRQSLLNRITDADRTASTRRSGYVLVRLDPVAFHDAEAVAWEFEYYDEAGNTLHCSAHYWMVGNIEYVLYAQSLRSDWEETEPVLEQMIEAAGPVR